MLKRTLVILMGVALLVCAPAFAVDGVVLINQATVTAAGGFPYKITQPGSYKLSGNLVVSGATADGIDITVSNVSLDLNGFTISGPGTCTFTGSAIPVSCTGSAGIGVSTITPLTERQNVSIRNGSVVGFATGIEAEAVGLLVEEVHASGNQTGLAVSNAVLRRNTATQNSELGIAADFSTVTENVANFNNIGLHVFESVYGSNSLTNNGTAVTGALFGLSQNNNSCNGVAC